MGRYRLKGSKEHEEYRGIEDCRVYVEYQLNNENKKVEFIREFDLIYKYVEDD